MGKDMIISVLLPYRGKGVPERLEKLKTCLRTLKDATERPEALEVIMAVDSDDEGYPDAITALEASGLVQLSIKTVPGKSPVEKWNMCQEYSLGDIYLCCGHDIEFRTKGWDVRLRDVIGGFPNNIGVAYMNDKHWLKGQKCTNHAVHRKWVDAVGYWMLPDLWLYYSDDVMTELGKNTNMHFMHDTIMEHNHPCRKDRDVKNDDIYVANNTHWDHDKAAFANWKATQMEEDIKLLLEAMK